MNLRCFVLCAAAALCLVSQQARAQKSPEEKLNMTMYAIMNMYVDTVDKETFVNDLIVKAMAMLDPFSAYLTPEQARLNEEALLGAGGEASGEAGTGPNGAGAPVAAGSLSGGSGTVEAYILEKKVGYIRLSMFSESTPQEFRSAVAALKKQGMKKLILDIQDNPGGFVESAIAVADELLDGEKAVVTTVGAHIPAQTATTCVDGCFEKGKLVLLVNGGTMSAAEILAGALRDWDRAVLVGSTTYGKGLIQETLPFADGSALRITVARYLTPCGMSIQKPYEGYSRLYADPSLTYRSLVRGRPLTSAGGIAPDVPAEGEGVLSAALAALE